MSHPFGDLVSQHLHRKHGLSQSKLAEAMLQKPTIVTRMCKGERLTGPQARERVVAIIGWLRQQSVLDTLDEANALLDAAGMSSLHGNGGNPIELALAQTLHPEREPEVAARLIDRARQVNGTELASSVHTSSTSSIPEDVVRLPIRKHNLPAELTSFIGRMGDIEEIAAQVRVYRLVTLIGAGGIGKTRLAIEVAADFLDDFDHGVWFVELAPLADPELIPKTILATIGISEQPSKTPLEILKEYLHEKKLLVILDNCEHLIEASAMVSNQLLKAAPNLKVIASSREALGVKGELVYPVRSLSLPDPKHLSVIEQLVLSEAVQLFIDRALLVTPHFVVDEYTLPFIAQICCRLDGIPLAIELAAARTKIMSVEHIAARLNDRFHLLTGGARTALPRQQTLRASIDWSYDILAENERWLLRRLSVFAGGWTLEAAEGLCAGDGSLSYEVLDLLTQLVNKSLVVVAEHSQSGENRHRMLETIRQYASGKLVESGEWAETRDRHIAYLVQLAEHAEQELTGPRQVTWLNRLESELDNIQVALEWALERNVEMGLRLASALIKFWEAHGYHRDGCNWLSQLLNRPESLMPTFARAKALSVMSYLTTEQGDFTRARLLAEESLTLYRELGDKHGVAYGLFVLGYATCWHGDVPMGRSLFANSLALYREVGDKLGISETLGNLGNWADPEDYLRAQTYMKQSLAVCRELGHLAGIGDRLTNLGLRAMYQGDFASARSAMQEGSAVHRQLGERGAVFSLYYLGDLAYWQGNYEQAHAYYRESLALSQETGRNTVAHWSYVNLGFVALRQGDPARARALFQAGWTLSGDFDDAGLSVSRILEGWASLALAEGRPERAMRLFACATANRLATGQTRSRLNQAEVDRELVIIRSQLGEESITSASAVGRAMTLEHAIKYALADE